MDPRTLWLTRPDDRYQPNPVLRSAERAVHPFLRVRPLVVVTRRNEPLRESLTANG